MRYLVIAAMVCLVSPVWAQKTQDHGSYSVYVPKGVSPAAQAPLILTFSPNANAEQSIAPWKPAADKYGLVVYGTTSVRNGQDFRETFAHVERELNEVLRSYPIDRRKIVCTGFSGGAMVSYGLASQFPQQIRAVVANTGMMNEAFQTSSFPRNKVAVLLASPEDFRFQEMNRDREFLETQGWNVHWLEFQGGHTYAPAATYLKAAGWLLPRL